LDQFRLFGNGCFPLLRNYNISLPQVNWEVTG
jgi:hypothetical protein